MRAAGDAVHELVTSGRGRKKLEVDVSIVCAPNAARGRFNVTFEGFVAFEPTSGFEADIANSYAQTSATLHIR